MKILFLSVMLTLAFTSTSFADLLIEPGVAYRTGTYDFGSGNTGKTSGVGLNARAAFTFPMLFAGLDVSYSFGTSTPDSGSSGDLTAVTAGPVVGVNLPALPLRFWLAYLFWDYSTAKASTPVSHDVINSGTAIKIGGGYTIIPLLSVNLEYVTHAFSKSEDKFTNTTADVSGKGTEFVVSASIPLSL